MFRKLNWRYLLPLCLLAVILLQAQNTVSVQGYPNAPFPTQTFTASAQSSNTATYLNGFGSGTISIIGNTLTTATWEIDGSNDGVNFFKLPTAIIGTPGTLTLTETSTTNGLYVVNLAGIVSYKFATSGTFTATNIKLKLVASVNRGLI